MKTNANQSTTESSLIATKPPPSLALALSNIACDDYTPPDDSDLNAWCPADPTVQWCRSGDCDEEYQCISYCIRHHPVGDTIDLFTFGRAPEPELLIDAVSPSVGLAVGWIDNRSSQQFIGLSTLETCFR